MSSAGAGVGAPVAAAVMPGIFASRAILRKMTEAPLTGVDATRRTRLANERTFLAWWRTSMATLGLSIAVGKLLPEVSDEPHWPYVTLGLVFALLGSALSLLGWWRYAELDRALRGGDEARAPTGSPCASPRCSACSGCWSRSS